MLQLKGLNEIDIILNDYLARFDLTASLGTDFCIYPFRNHIDYALVVSENMNDWFLEYAQSCGLGKDVDIFLISLFHEIGHSMTWDEIDDVTYDYCMHMKDTLGSSRADAFTYFQLADEAEATAWAIEYIQENIDEVKELWSRLRPAIMNFYKVNNIH